MSKLIEKIVSKTHIAKTTKITYDYSHDSQFSVVNNQELQIASIEKSFHNWTIPKIDVKTIYQIGKFNFLQDYRIKTTEHLVPINKFYETLSLFSRQSIFHLIKKNTSFSTWA